MSFTLGYDAIHDNVDALPPGQAAGYTTGSPDIKWTLRDWALKPGAVRICQDYGLSDATADVADVERGAGTPDQAGDWATRAQADIAAAKRPGQRKMPACYQSASNVTPVVNALLAHGHRSGIGLWVANWNLTEAQAIADVLLAAGPFPIIGIQWTDIHRLYDNDVFSAGWLADCVGGAPPPPPPPPTLVEGDTGSWVTLAQHDLNRHGANPQLLTDGIFGMHTESAVVIFQGRHGLVQDGIIGPKTWAALAA